VSAKRVVHPLEIPADLEAKVLEAAAAMGKSKAETMRIAMHIGLRRLGLYEYDPYGAVATADPPAAPTQQQRPPPLASLPPHKSRSSKKA
jgi:hypothetical protein